MQGNSGVVKQLNDDVWEHPQSTFLCCYPQRLEMSPFVFVVPCPQPGKKRVISAPATFHRVVHISEFPIKLSGQFLLASMECCLNDLFVREAWNGICGIFYLYNKR